MDQGALLFASQLASGASAAVAVLLALVAIPRSMMEAADRRKSEYATHFFESLRRSMESCIDLMRTMDARRTQIVNAQKGDKAVGNTLNFLSVEVALDRFRSDLSQTLYLYTRAKGRAAPSDLMGLFRLLSHLTVLADVHSQDDAKELEREVGHAIYSGDLGEHIYKCAVIVHWIENDIEKSPVYIEIRRTQPNLLSDMEVAYNKYWKDKEAQGK